MGTKAISNALEEVWEIKESIYQEDKDCSVLESLKRVHRIAEEMLKDEEKTNGLNYRRLRCRE